MAATQAKIEHELSNKRISCVHAHIKDHKHTAVFRTSRFYLHSACIPRLVARVSPVGIAKAMRISVVFHLQEMGAGCHRSISLSHSVSLRLSLRLSDNCALSFSNPGLHVQNILRENCR